MEKCFIWDIFICFFYWLLVVCILVQYLIVEVFDVIDWYFKIGYFILGLILFRLCWGFVGIIYVKFSQFFIGFGKVVVYVKILINKYFEEYVGYNLFGGWMVIVLLLLVVVQGISGLFIGDDIFSNGFYYDVVFDVICDVMNVIYYIVFNVLLVVIVLYVGVVVFYVRYKKQFFVLVMLYGKKMIKVQGISLFCLLVVVIFVLIVIVVMYVFIEVLLLELVVEEFFYQLYLV